VIASYAYTDAKITKDTAGKEGRRLGAPRHGGSFWTRYQFLQGPLDGLSLGAGVFVVGKRQGDLFGLADNTFQVPGYVRADLLATYRWQIGKTALTAQLNVENLFNREYIIAAGGEDDPDLSLTPGPPRIILGSIRVEF
jgi:iron complex outermembrane receptor protein